MHPKTTVRIEDEKPAQQLLKLMEMLEDLTTCKMSSPILTFPTLC